MKFHTAIQRLHPRHVFRISRGERHFSENALLFLDHEGVQGVGEASPIAYYSETAEAVVQRLQGLSTFLSQLQIDTTEDIARAWSEAWPLLQPSRAAQCALDLALWDWLARRRGCTVCELAHGQRSRPVTSFCTIGLSSPEEFRQKLDELRDFAAIKVKSEAGASLAPVRAVAEGGAPLLAVDANGSWAEQDLPALASELATYRVAFIEQPLPAERYQTLQAGGCALPIFADESCVTEDQLPAVLRRYDGFNVKLVKCGGLTPALRMLQAGRAAGRKTMVGCMLESSVLIAAGVVAAQIADYADLDGAWLLRDDPWRGLRFDRGILYASPAPGFGLAPSAVV